MPKRSSSGSANGSSLARLRVLVDAKEARELAELVEREETTRATLVELRRDAAAGRPATPEVLTSVAREYVETRNELSTKVIEAKRPSKEKA